MCVFSELVAATAWSVVWVPELRLIGINYRCATHTISHNPSDLLFSSNNNSNFKPRAKVMVMIGLLSTCTPFSIEDRQFILIKLSPIE